MKDKRERFAVQLDASFLKTVDEWRRKQADRPSRAVAIRELGERGLASSAAPPHRKQGSRRKAAEMAGQEIDRRLDNQTATEEERARRKHRLIKGPREFRDMRADQPKNKG